MHSQNILDIEQSKIFCKSIPMICNFLLSLIPLAWEPCMTRQNCKICFLRICISAFEWQTIFFVRLERMHVVFANFINELH